MATQIPSGNAEDLHGVARAVDAGSPPPIHSVLPHPSAPLNPEEWGETDLPSTPAGCAGEGNSPQLEALRLAADLHAALQVGDVAAAGTLHAALGRWLAAQVLTRATEGHAHLAAEVGT